MLGRLLAVVWITDSNEPWLLAGYTRRGLVGLQGTSAGGLLVAALLNRYVLCSAWCYLQFVTTWCNAAKLEMGVDAPVWRLRQEEHMPAVASVFDLKSKLIVLLCIASSGLDLV